MAKSVWTLVPGRDPIELVAYYDQFAAYYPECELQTKRWFVDHIQHDWILVDAGANIGYYSILFSQLAPRGKVYAFEPTETITLLRENLEHHHCANVTALPIALGSASGRREDDIYRIWGDAPERRLYDFSTLDSWAQREGLKRLDCIKIDVDSFDLDVLRGSEQLLRRFDPWVVVELNYALAKRGQSVPEALEWLYTIGYRSALVLDYENYVLRRAGQDTAATTTRPTVTLSFETRPVILSRQFKKLAQIPAVFEPTPQRINAESSLKMERKWFAAPAWSISVPGPRWVTAAMWRRTETQLSEDPLIVEVDVAVSGVPVGIGCVNSGHSAYIGKEVNVSPASAMQTCVVEAERGCDVASLVLRNIDPAALPSSVRVSAIRTYAGAVLPTAPSSTILDPSKQRISLDECREALAGRQAAANRTSPDEPAIDIVGVENLGTALGFPTPLVPAIRVYRRPLAEFKTETDEAAIFSYLYSQFQPRRHLEFGTWEGWGTALCASSCEAEIWTINLPDGERDAHGNPCYGPPNADLNSFPSELQTELTKNGGQMSSDSGGFIGWRYRAAGYGQRVHQLLGDSRELDISQFAPGFFDTAFIDGGHTRAVAESDSAMALHLVRAGGLVIWHDFCPDAETLQRNEAPRGVVEAVIENFAIWRPKLSKLFWIRPTWILVGVKA